MRELKQLVRENVWNMKPYACTDSKSDKKVARILLNANENPYNNPINRLPDPMQKTLREKISCMTHINPECMFLGNGICETVDVIYRCFAEPAFENVVAFEPTSGPYRRYAEINNIEYRTVELDSDFGLSADKILAACDKDTKVIWLCSPNDPTGNDLDRNEILSIAERFEGIVVIDESYSDFSKSQSYVREIHLHPNLVVMKTFDNSWGCAGLQISMAIAYADIIEVLNKVKYPHNISQPAQERMVRQIDNRYEVDKWKNIILMERDRMAEAFKLLPCCKKVYPSAANFFLAEMTDANAVYNHLKKNGIRLCNVSEMPLCSNCLRITIGSKTENSELLSVLRQLEEEQ